MAAKKRHYSSDRSQAMRDSGMLREDKSQVANMPQDVKYHAWGKPRYGSIDAELNDTISGINEQMGRDESQARKNMVPHKY